MPTTREAFQQAATGKTAKAPLDTAVAFSRNLGWKIRKEQEALGPKRIEIAATGGVYSSHLVTLTPLEIGGGFGRRRGRGKRKSGAERDVGGGSEVVLALDRSCSC